MEFQDIPVGQLLLDTKNPRHEPEETQRKAIHAVIAEQGSKLPVLARHIAERGLNPMDRALVIRTGKNFTILEGNRRLTAIKLLLQPDLAEDTPIEASIRKLATNAQVPETVACAIMKSREAARPWLILRHTGESDGAGVVPWNALASARFDTKPGSQAAKAISFLDAIRSAFPNDDELGEDIESIEAKRLTTLGRLVSDPDFRALMGIQENGQTFLFHYPPEALRATLAKLLRDVADHLSVTKIKNKPQRLAYLKSLPAPPVAQHTVTAQPLQALASSRTRKSAPRRQPKPVSPFKALDLSKLDPRIQAILMELQAFDLERFPNAAAVLTRALIELAVGQFITLKGLSSKGELRTRIKTCLHAVDQTGKAPDYQGVRAGLDDGTSLFATTTLHAYVHNPHFHPTPSDIRAIVTNFTPFLQAMNDNA